MSPILVFSIIVAYFGLLIFISFLTSRNSTNATFYTANRQSPWYVVAFGMIGASLSGVTFISVPGEVGNSGLMYYQVVMGYLVGYLVIAKILLPLYYKLNLVSIYTYLEQRFGSSAYHTGSVFFIISRVIGASFRLFLVAGVLQIAFFNAFNIPFAVTVAVTIALIWVYTIKAGIKTIVWTDTLQTAFMLLAVFITIFIIANRLELSTAEMVATIKNSPHGQLFNWDWKSSHFFFKQFVSGALITIVMTGLDQDMMQKNLTCRNLKDAQKNMYWYGSSFLVVNIFFLALGVLLYFYIEQMGISLTDVNSFHFDAVSGRFKNTDELYSILALHHFGTLAGIVFLIGIIAAAFSSADSALTSLTTAFSIDILKLDINSGERIVRRKKLLTHLGFSIILYIVILVFNSFNDESVIMALFKVAGYTYGPLLGMFAFGMFTKFEVKDKLIPIVAILSPIITILINAYSEQLLWGYKFGFEVLLLNGLLMFLGLVLIQDKN